MAGLDSTAGGEDVLAGLGSPIAVELSSMLDSALETSLEAQQQVRTSQRPSKRRRVAIAPPRPPTPDGSSASDGDAGEDGDRDDAKEELVGGVRPRNADGTLSAALLSLLDGSGKPHPHAAVEAGEVAEHTGLQAAGGTGGADAQLLEAGAVMEGGGDPLHASTAVKCIPLPLPRDGRALTVLDPRPCLVGGVLTLASWCTPEGKLERSPKGELLAHVLHPQVADGLLQCLLLEAHLRGEAADEPLMSVNVVMQPPPPRGHVQQVCATARTSTNFTLAVAADDLAAGTMVSDMADSWTVAGQLVRLNTSSGDQMLPVIAMAVLRGVPRRPDAPATFVWDGREASGVIVGLGFAALTCPLDGHLQEQVASCFCPDSDPPSLPNHNYVRPPWHGRVGNHRRSATTTALGAARLAAAPQPPWCVRRVAADWQHRPGDEEGEGEGWVGGMRERLEAAMAGKDAVGALSAATLARTAAQPWPLLGCGEGRAWPTRDMAVAAIGTPAPPPRPPRKPPSGVRLRSAAAPRVQAATWMIDLLPAGSGTPEELVAAADAAMGELKVALGEFAEALRGRGNTARVMDAGKLVKLVAAAATAVATHGLARGEAGEEKEG